jgi:hypothetical protein
LCSFLFSHESITQKSCLYSSALFAFLSWLWLATSSLPLSFARFGDLDRFSAHDDMSCLSSVNLQVAELEQHIWNDRSWAERN